MRIAILVAALLLAGCEKEKPEFMPGQFVKLRAASVLLPVYGQVTYPSCGYKGEGCGYYVRWPDGKEHYMQRFEIEAVK
jgi:hypothetical protein